MVNESLLFLLFVFVVSYANFYILHSNGRKVFSISHALAIAWLVGYCLKILSLWRRHVVISTKIRSNRGYFNP